MTGLVQKIGELKAQLADHPDVMPDERVRIEANAWIVRTMSLGTAVLAAPLAVIAAAALMMLIDGSRESAAVCGVIAALGVVGGVGLVRTIGLSLERAYLERVVGRAAVREIERLASANASHSSVAVPSMVTLDR